MYAVKNKLTAAWIDDCSFLTFSLRFLVTIDKLSIAIWNSYEYMIVKCELKTVLGLEISSHYIHDFLLPQCLGILLLHMQPEQKVNKYLSRRNVTVFAPSWCSRESTHCSLHCLSTCNWSVAQLAEQLHWNRKDVGSIPTGGIFLVRSYNIKDITLDDHLPNNHLICRLSRKCRVCKRYPYHRSCAQRSNMSHTR